MTTLTILTEDRNMNAKRLLSILVALLLVTVCGRARAASTWKQLPGCASSIAGSWMVSCAGHYPGGAPIYQWDGGQWSQSGFTGVTPVVGPMGQFQGVSYNWQGATNITTDAGGVAWVVTEYGSVQKFNGPDFRDFGGYNCDGGDPVCATSWSASTLAVGANDDAWIIACDLWPGSNSDYAIRHWNGSCWEKTPGAADQVAVDYDGTAWVINSLGDLYFFGGGAYHQVPGSYTSITRGAALPASGGKIAPWAPFGELVIGNVPGDVVQLAATTTGSPTSPEVGALFAMDLGGFIYQYEGVNAVSFQNQTAAGDSSYDFDWDICRGKRTCPVGQGLIGLSVGLGAVGAGHSAICLPDWGFDGIPSATLTVDDGVDQRRYDRTGGDWSPGYLKLECGKGEYVSGVSEDALSCPPSPEDNAFHAIQCSQPRDADSFGSTLCTARSVDSQGSDGDFLTGVDWDPWFSKGACRATEFVAGISVVPWTREPHALLCCARE